MKKLNLNVEDLRIDSFATDVAEVEGGTVHGAQLTAVVSCLCTRQGCYQPSEPGYATYVNGRCIRC